MDPVGVWSAPPSQAGSPSPPVSPPTPATLLPNRASRPVDGLSGRLRRSPRILVVAGGVAVVATVCSVVLLATGSRSHTISGTMTVVDSSAYSSDGAGEPCSPGGGYDDISAGIQVVVRDESRTTLSTGNLSSGRRVRDACEFSFSVSDVEDAAFYEVTMGSDSRGGLQYSRDEMDENGWTVALSLGS